MAYLGKGTSSFTPSLLRDSPAKTQNITSHCSVL
jgi:hypothetical protein